MVSWFRKLLRELSARPLLLAALQRLNWRREKKKVFCDTRPSTFPVWFGFKNSSNFWRKAAISGIWNSVHSIKIKVIGRFLKVTCENGYFSDKKYPQSFRKEDISGSTGTSKHLLIFLARLGSISRSLQIIESVYSPWKFRKFNFLNSPVIKSSLVRLGSWTQKAQIDWAEPFTVSSTQKDANFEFVFNQLSL